MKEENRTLKCVLTKEELANRSSRMAKACQDLKEIEAQAKSAAEQFKGDIATEKLTIDKMSNVVNQGHEYREVKCGWRLRTPSEKLKSCIRLDTGEVIEIVDMSMNELQSELGIA